MPIHLPRISKEAVCFEESRGGVRPRRLGRFASSVRAIVTMFLRVDIVLKNYERTGFILVDARASEADGGLKQAHHRLLFVSECKMEVQRFLAEIFDQLFAIRDRIAAVDIDITISNGGVEFG